MYQIYPWQKQEWQYLLKRKTNAQLPHAILIKGCVGLGKSHFARCFAELLLCKKSSFKACGTCDACSLLQVNTHPDLLIVQPQERGEVIKIEQIREVVTELGNTSQRGGYKVVIVNNAELLNISASNALLKTLEEPIDNVIIILVTDHPASLSATILSRCQAISIKTPTYAQIQEWMRQEESVLSEDLKIALNLTENSPLNALRFIDENVLSKRNKFFECLYSLQNKKISIIQAAEQCLNFEIKFLLIIFMNIVRDLVKMKYGVSDAIVNLDKSVFLDQLKIKTSLSKLFCYQDLLLKTHEYLLKNINLNQQLAVENLLINWHQLFV